MLIELIYGVVETYHAIWCHRRKYDDRVLSHSLKETFCTANAFAKQPKCAWSKAAVHVKITL